jgi:hypothetical protein
MSKGHSKMVARNGFVPSVFTEIPAAKHTPDAQPSLYAEPVRRSIMDVVNAGRFGTSIHHMAEAAGKAVSDLAAVGVTVRRALSDPKALLTETDTDVRVIWDQTPDETVNQAGVPVIVEPDGTEVPVADVEDFGAEVAVAAQVTDRDVELASMNRDQLRAEAARLGVAGRGKMTKVELYEAVCLAARAES